jgi:hypothetical protein
VEGDVRAIKPVAKKFSLEERPDDLPDWRALPLEERLKAVREMALFWAKLELERARERGEDPEIALDRILPVAKKRPLK